MTPCDINVLPPKSQHKLARRQWHEACVTNMGTYSTRNKHDAMTLTCLLLSMFNSLKSQTAFHGLLGFVNLWYFHRVQKDQPYHSSYHFCIYDICIELYTSLGLAGIAWSHGLCVILYVRLSTYSLYWSLSIYKRIHVLQTKHKMLMWNLNKKMILWLKDNIFSIFTCGKINNT